MVSRSLPHPLSGAHDLAPHAPRNAEAHRFRPRCASASRASSSAVLASTPRRWASFWNADHMFHCSSPSTATPSTTSPDAIALSSSSVISSSDRRVRPSSNDCGGLPKPLSVAQNQSRLIPVIVSPWRRLSFAARTWAFVCRAGSRTMAPRTVARFMTP